MKKILSIAVATVLTLGTGGTLARQNSEKAPFCELYGCTQTEAHTHSVCADYECAQAVNHEHNGVIYFAHHENDGHNHEVQSAVEATTPSASSYNCGVTGCDETGNHNHVYCTVSGCNQMTNHKHNGIVYYGHSSDDGHAYHNCGLSGCLQNDSHIHGSCGVSGCNQTGNHNHNNGRHRQGRSGCHN